MISSYPRVPTRLIVKNRVADFDLWKKGFEFHLPERLAAGLHERSIFRSVESSEDFFVIFDISNPTRAQEFIASSSLKAFKETLGILAEPQYFFLYETELSKQPSRRSIREAIVSAFKAVDAMNSAMFAEFFAQTGRFQFANQDAVVGPVEIEKYVRGFFSSIKSLSHHIEEYMENESCASVRSKIVYGRLNGSIVEIPFANFFELSDDGKFQRWQILIDLAPLHL